MKKNFLTLLFCGFSLWLFAQTPAMIGEKTKNLKKYTGYFTFYWDENDGKIWLEIDKFDQEFLYVSSLAAGLGSNDIGLDRGALGGQHLVVFQKVGNKVLLVKPNQDYRAVSKDENEKRAVRESFAQSILWGFTVEAREGNKVLVNMTDFLLRDAHGIAQTIKKMNQGTYRQDLSRSAVYLPRTKNFPKNSEFEATLTFVGGEDAGNYVQSVVPAPEAISLRLHHSFVELPDADYKMRAFDPRSGYYPLSFFDYATPVQEPIQKNFIYRHRLRKKNPEAAISDPVKPIIYYLDNGCPEPIRSALLEGASWWNQAFEAAGYRNAFQVRMLPDSVDPMDVRYNVIQWVHRSTRGWSYGANVNDPRTGEIIKGHVTLGSLRVRQDYMIAEGLLAPYENGKSVSPEMMKMALARLRQLSAHEVGHTIGIMHNYSSSVNSRASVMDYPHPQIKFDKNGQIDLSEAYATGIGEWDKMAVAYGYQDFPAKTDEKKALNEILENGIKKGLLFISDRDARAAGGSHPEAHLWDNGKNPMEELEHLLKVREKAFSNFSEKNIQNARPMAFLEDVLVPIYHLHRYQLEAVSKLVGGNRYAYSVRNDGQVLNELVSKEQQQKALESLAKALSPEVLTIPENIIRLIPPRPAGYEYGRELFERRTGLALDPIMAAEALTAYSLSFVLHSQRANRMVEYKARQNNLGLDEMLNFLIEKTWKNSRKTGLELEVQRASEQVLLTYLLALSLDDNASWQTKGMVSKAIQDLKTWIEAEKAKTTDFGHQVHLEMALKRIASPDKAKIATHKQIPMGAPIGCE